MKEEIKQFRVKYSLTQDALSRHLNVDRQSIHNWEKGRTPPPAMLKLALMALDEKLKEGGDATH